MVTESAAISQLTPGIVKHVRTDRQTSVVSRIVDTLELLLTAGHAPGDDEQAYWTAVARGL
jgi:hypothetical protein